MAYYPVDSGGSGWYCDVGSVLEDQFTVGQPIGCPTAPLSSWSILARAIELLSTRPRSLAAFALGPSGLRLQLRDAVTERPEHIAMVVRPSGEHLDHVVPGLDLIFLGFE